MAQSMIYFCLCLMGIVLYEYVKHCILVLIRGSQTTVWEPCLAYECILTSMLSRVVVFVAPSLLTLLSPPLMHFFPTARLIT